MKRLSVVFVTNNYTPYSGGVVSSINAFAAGLRECGCSVCIVTLDFKDAPHEKDVVRLYCPVKFTYKNNPMAVPWYTEQALEQLFLQIKPDIVHSHHPFLLGNGARNVCKKLHIPLVFTHHTQYDQYLHYLPVSKKLTRPVVNQLVSYYCRGVNLIIAPSASIKKQLEKQEAMSPIKVLPSPLLPVFTDMMPRFESKSFSDTCKLLYVGRFTQEKNICVLLDLVKDLGSPFLLRLVGYGYYQKELERYAYNELNLSRRQVEFVNKPSKMIIAKYYKDSDLFVFASKSETQGLVMLEAMSAGTPVIALKGAGQNDVVENRVNGFLVDSKDQMRETIQMIFKDQKLYKSLQRGAWQKAQKYSIMILTKDLLLNYAELIVDR